jgi:hemolysin III
MTHGLHVRFGADAGNDVPLGHVLRPTFRGAVHAIGLVLAVPALVALLMNSTAAMRLRVGLVVYTLALCSMLGTSTVYHRWVHGLRARSAWRRLDHAAVFGAIAGSCTPVIVAALPGAPGLVLVAVVWSAALLGALCKLSRRPSGDREGTAMYAVTIVLGSVALPWLWAREGVLPAALLLAGGVAYLVGAACFAAQRPTLRPAVFSYHEVWHVFTLIAAAAQFAAIWMLTT